MSIDAVSLGEGFWSRRQEINRRVSLRNGYQELEQAGSFHNLRLAAGLSEGPYRGLRFMDSDVYKWLEAVSYELANTNDPELEHLAEQTIDLLAAAQQDDGYLNSYYQVAEPGKRWTDLDHGHEMYCAGHLIQAAVAYQRAARKARLLEVACRFADHIASTFGPGLREGTCGHPEIEMALVELYRETRQRRYLDLAGFLIDQRGRGRMRGYGSYGPEYHQDRLPVRKASQVEGHAVRQLYLCSGVADLYIETGEPALLQAMLRLWRDMTAHKMYLTGGYGARFEGESFGDAYELPSDRCYCETCAAIAAMMWNWRMLLATGEVRFADSLERSLYNGFLSGVSLDGCKFLYVNPLQSRGSIERSEWFRCACCPPNVMRQVASIGHCMSTQTPDGVQLHQYMSASIQIDRQQGSSLSLRLQTDYPWDGHVKVNVEETGNSVWRLAMRIPAWCQGASLKVNGQTPDLPLIAGTYAEIERAWQAGDVVELYLPMRPGFIQPNPRIDALRGSLAIQRGPLIYCVEQLDQQAGVNLLDVQVDSGGPLQDTWRGDLLDGVVTVEAQGFTVDTGNWGDQLYRPLTLEIPTRSPVKLTAIPYFAWANREPGAMGVWVPGM